MKGKLNYDGVSTMDGSFELLPDGIYDLEITADIREKTTTKGNYPMASFMCEVVDSIKHEGRTIWHNVVLFPGDAAGAGITKHFLKTIGQPFDGDFSFDTDKWIGKRFRAEVTSAEYNGKTNNKISKVLPYEGTGAPAKKDSGSDVPF